MARAQVSSQNVQAQNDGQAQAQFSSLPLPEGPSTPTSSPQAATPLTPFKMCFCPAATPALPAAPADVPCCLAQGARQDRACQVGTEQTRLSKVSSCTGSAGRRGPPTPPPTVAASLKAPAAASPPPPPAPAPSAPSELLANSARCLQRGQSGSHQGAPTTLSVACTESTKILQSQH